VSIEQHKQNQIIQLHWWSYRIRAHFVPHVCTSTQGIWFPSREKEWSL